MTDPRHNLPSASSFAMSIACPGWQQLRATLPVEALISDQGDQEQAQFGNHVHEARKTGNPINLSEDESKAYHNGLEIEKKILSQWLEDKQLSREGVVEVPPMEARYWLNDPGTMEPVCSGEPDIVYIHKPHALLVDWKSLGGYWAPRAESNTQLRVYAILLYREFDGITDIRVALNRCTDSLYARDFADYTETDLLNSEQAIQFHSWEARHAGAPRRAGEHCRYCPCRAHCPEAAAYSMLPCASLGRAITTQDIPALVGALPLPDLVRLWKTKGTVGKILEAVTDRLKGLEEEQLAALGLGKGKGANRNVVVNKDLAFFHLRNLHNWTEDELFACLTFSLSKLAEVAKKHNPTLDKADCEAWVKKELARWIEVKPSDKPIVEL